MTRKSVIIKSFVASTAPIPKYKGYIIPSETIYTIAKNIREGRTVLGIEHDRKQSFPYRTLKSEVRKTDNGELGVWVELEVDEEIWEAVEGKRAFSVTVEEAYHFPNPTDAKPKIIISADPAYIEGETFRTAIDELEPYCAVEARHLYQLSDLSPIAPIVVIITIASAAARTFIK